MLVLHAFWESSTAGALQLWAESSDLVTAGKRHVRAQASAESARPHPFAPPADFLHETLAAFAASFTLSEAQAQTRNLRLPTVTRGPLPSPDLLLDEALKNGDTPRLQNWQIPTLQLDASHALDFLLHLPTQTPRGLVAGQSLRYWAEAAQFAFELITHQSFIPTLSEEGRRSRTITCRASWEAVLSPDETHRQHTLASAMPPVCWSFLPADEQPATIVQDLLLHFLNQLIDAFARENIIQSPKRRNGRAKSSALSARWLQALTTPDPTFTANQGELATFSIPLHAWLDQVRPSPTETAFRTCFKLEPPETPASENGNGNGKGEPAPEPEWRISYHLQASDDPSLLIPADRVWQEQASTLTFLKRNFEHPQERLLADLGRATRLFPRIEESLRGSHPQDLRLSTEQAYLFLREAVPLLEDSGFGVLIPPWWGKAATRLAARLKLRPPGPSKSQQQEGSGLLGMNSLVNYSWDIAVGDTTLTPEEFAHLVSLKQPLVNVRGQWIELRPQEIATALAFFEKRQARQTMTLGEALRLNATVGEGADDTGLPINGVDTEGWVQDALKRLYDNAQLQPIEVPASFNGTLRPYQQRGVSWLAFLKQFGFGACLADHMGLGKTVEMISILLYEKEKTKGAKGVNPTLLICPMSIVGNWQRELQRFAPTLRVLVHHGNERLIGKDFVTEAQQHDVVITTYALALRDKEHLGEIEWENVVLDEAQNIKNEAAKQTQAIKKLNARHRIALTGTPVENRLSELWSIMEFLNPGYLGSASDFRKSFALPIERYRNRERASTLKRLVQPFILRRLKTDKEIIQDLPDKLEMKVFCNLTQEQASLYEAVVKDMLERIEEADGIERRGLILSALMKLKQICNHPAQFMSDGSDLSHRSGKLARLKEMLEEVLAEGDKALIFTQFAEMGTMLRTYLQETFGVETLFLHGGTQKKQRDLLVQRFQEEQGHAPLFILSLKAGGVGLNLTAANHVFHFDRWWNPAVEDQATDRAFRIGQQRNVQVHKFVCIGTLEERIDQMIEMKKDLAEQIVGAGENWLTEMSTAQLRELFALSRDAIGEE